MRECIGSMNSLGQLKNGSQLSCRICRFMFTIVSPYRELIPPVLSSLKILLKHVNIFSHILRCWNVEAA